MASAFHYQIIAPIPFTRVPADASIPSQVINRALIVPGLHLTTAAQVSKFLDIDDAKFPFNTRFDMAFFFEPITSPIW